MAPRPPDTLAALGAERLHAFGMTRAKASYLLGLASSVHSGQLDLDHLEDLDDQAAIKVLTAIRGIGLWSAQLVLIHQLRRPDVLPAADIALQVAIQHAWHLPARPTEKQVAARALPWFPYCTYAASLL